MATIERKDIRPDKQCFRIYNKNINWNIMNEFTSDLLAEDVNPCFISN